MSKTYYVFDAEVDPVSQRVLTYLADHADDRHVVVGDMEANDVGTSHQINYRIREHLLPADLVTSPGAYEYDGAARAAKVWVLTDKGRACVEQYSDLFARPTTLREVMERLDDVEEVALDAVERAEDTVTSMDSARSEVSRAKQAADEQVRTMQETMGSWREVRDEVSELPTDEDLEDVETLLRRERDRELNSLEGDLNQRVDHAFQRIEGNETDIADIDRELDETQTKLTEWTSYLAAKEERSGGIRGWLRGE
jgi:chromosome segregation ATPase